MTATEPAWTGRPAVLLALGLGLALLLAARNPDVLLHPEFWAEDGWVWFPDAYQDGWRSLARPLAGYLQTVSRGVGLLAQAFPLAWAPAVFAVAALMIQVLPPLFLVSSRMAGVWGDARGRLLFALLWVALPNTQEVHVNLTNAQWHLAALAFLVLLSAPAQRWPGRAFDAVALLVSGLSGPFCVVLAPAAVWVAAVRRDRASLWRAGVLLATAAVQAAFVLATVGERSPATLGAGPRLLARIVAQQVLLGPLVGQGNMTALQQIPQWETNLLPLSLAAAGVGLTAAVLARGSTPVRMAVLSGALLLGAALLRPQISMTGAQWPLMQAPGTGQRYYYLPMLAWLAVLFAAAGSRAWGLRLVGVPLLLLAAFGVYSDWRMPSRAPTGFAEAMRRFEASPPGTTMSFEFHPLFEQMPMRLTKR